MSVVILAASRTVTVAEWWAMKHSSTCCEVGSRAPVLVLSSSAGIVLSRKWWRSIEVLAMS